MMLLNGAVEVPIPPAIFCLWDVGRIIPLRPALTNATTPKGLFHLTACSGTKRSAPEVSTRFGHIALVRAIPRR